MPQAGSSTISPRLRVDLLDDEPDHRPRRVELARVAGGVAHLAQHRLVEVRHRVDVVGRVEVDLVDLVDDVAQQVAGEHPVVGLLEHRGERVARIVLAWCRTARAGTAAACR